MAGVIPAGWTRWLLEQFEFPYTIVYPPEIDAGNLKAKYDVLVFADGTVPASADGPWKGRTPTLPKPEDIPAKYGPWLGLVSDQTSVPQLKGFYRCGRHHHHRGQRQSPGRAARRAAQAGAG